VDSPTDEGNLESIMTLQSSSPSGSPRGSAGFFIESSPEQQPKEKKDKKTGKQPVDPEIKAAARQRAKERYHPLESLAPGLVQNRKILADGNLEHRDPETMSTCQLEIKIHNLRVERKHLKRDILKADGELDNLRQELADINERLPELEFQIEDAQVAKYRN
jgi:hypothetical protein